MTSARTVDVQLRKFNQGDVEKLIYMANNSSVSVNLRDSFPSPYSRDDAESFIESANSHKPITTFAIDYEGQYVGNIGLEKGDDVYRKSAELGFFLGEEYWNKGIMTKAVKLIVDFGFNKLDIIRIHASVFQFNEASHRVFEKCGFQKEAILKKAIYKNRKILDEIIYAKIKGE
jgi:ribosomal-protein-alanine N-acetyltransferase